MDVPSYFTDFLKEIRLSPSQIDDLITGHKTLRKRLEADDDLSKIIVSTFLQGSYRRSTAVKPKAGARSDVDVIVVTKLDKDEYTPQEALDLFIPFLEKYYKGKYRIQGRSIGIELSYVDLDIVPTAAPSESEKGILDRSDLVSDYTIEDLMSDARSEFAIAKSFWLASKSTPQWQLEPLLIPDRDADEWKETHPLEQIRWTIDKNANCNKHYINVVKALKWWRKIKYPDVKNPKSYPLEHFIGQCCPDGITSVASGVVLALERIVSDYPNKPFLPDHGVPSHDVFARITTEEYAYFYETVCVAAQTARKALDSEDLSESVGLWRELFGNEFKNAPETKSSSASGFTQRNERTTSIPEGRFA